MTENVEKFMKLLKNDTQVAKRLKDAQDAYPGSWEIRVPFISETMLPLAEELGLPFTIDELRRYETKRKLSHTLDSDTEGDVPEEQVFYLIDQGWDSDTAMKEALEKE